MLKTSGWPVPLDLSLPDMGFPQSLSLTTGPILVPVNLNIFHLYIYFSTWQAALDTPKATAWWREQLELLQNVSDPHIALLSFRSTPLSWSSLSPAELLFGWKINTDIPQSNAQLTPCCPYLKDFHKADKEFKAKQEFYFHSRHRTQPLSSLIANDPVWVRMEDRQAPRRVIRPSTAPLSYIVSTPAGQVHSNRPHLTSRLEAYQDSDIDIDLGTSTTPSDGQREESPVQNLLRSPIRTCSHQTGTVIRPPSRFT